MSAITAADCTWRAEGGGLAVGERCLGFLRGVGIPVERFTGEQEPFLDGLAIVEGRLQIDPETAAWPADLLHEGGHIAVAAPQDRAQLGPIEADPAEEMMAIAWSYAAALECGVTLDQLFHDGGYRGGSAALRTAFARGAYVGAPMLGYHGMTGIEADPMSPKEHNYPAMLRWLR